MWYLYSLKEEKESSIALFLRPIMASWINVCMETRTNYHDILLALRHLPVVINVERFFSKFLFLPPLLHRYVLTNRYATFTSPSAFVTHISCFVKLFDKYVMWRNGATPTVRATIFFFYSSTRTTKRINCFDSSCFMILCVRRRLKTEWSLPAIS
jgi:hypothetical protein